MENPRKRLNRNDSKGRNGQVVNLSEYQSRRRRHDKNRRQPTRKQSSAYLVDHHTYLRWLCYVLIAISVICSILGLVALPWKAQFQIGGLLAATIGLACGLWLNVMKDRFATRVLIWQSATFAVAYSCGILHFFI